MIYQSIEKAVFLRRPNRFIAEVLVDGVPTTVHVKNTGRCRELLTEGATVYLEKGDNPQRKTPYDLVAVEKQLPGGNTLLINMDSQAPNEAAAEFLRSGVIFPDATSIRREVTKGNSRFDFLIEQGEKNTYLEVKGCTLENDGIASFPDAPTERGVKHIEELIDLKNEGYGAAILFIIQMKGITEFRPNDSTHRAFGDALRRAIAAGVDILAYDCIITPDTMTVDQPIEVKL